MTNKSLENFRKNAKIMVINHYFDVIVIKLPFYGLVQWETLFGVRRHNEIQIILFFRVNKS